MTAAVIRTRFGPFKEPDWDLILLLVALALLVIGIWS